MCLSTRMSRQGLSFKIESTSIMVGGVEISFDADETDVQLSGEFFLEFFGLEEDSLNYDWMMLTVWICIYFGLTWFALEALYRSRR